MFKNKKNQDQVEIIEPNMFLEAARRVTRRLERRKNLCDAIDARDARKSFMLAGKMIAKPASEGVFTLAFAGMGLYWLTQTIACGLSVGGGGSAVMLAMTAVYGRDIARGFARESRAFARDMKAVARHYKRTRQAKPAQNGL